MASKVMVKIPVVPFTQVNKSKNGSVSGEIVLSRSPERSTPTAPKNGTADQSQKTPDQIRITQLEHNVKFLQEQHQLMLNGLHTEVESLKTRNRELQFQLVFARGPIPANSPSTPSSPEDETKHKPFTSPKPPNCTPLQVELLEKELGEIKLHMTETENRNAYLSAIVDEQKKKLERYERDREKEQQQWANQVEEAELLRKLDDADMLIRRLRRENSDLRKEAAQPQVGLRREQTAQSSAAAVTQQQPNLHQGQLQYHQGGAQHHFNKDNNGYQPRPQGNRGGSNRHRSGNNGHPGSNEHQHAGNNGYAPGQHYNNRGGWFPPLHSQSFWQGGRPNDRSSQEPTNLPTLQHQLSEPGASNGAAGHHQYRDQYHHGRRGSNNNHYRNNGEGGRTYRNGGHKNGKPS